MMTLDSLDPRIKRWNLKQQRKADYGNPPLDQLPTYEVFLQMKEGKAFEHAGIVHAATPDMAFLFAKEQYSRRYTCTGMWVAPTDKVWVTAFTDLEENIYDHVGDITSDLKGPEEDYLVFHLTKRGKQHKHIGQVPAKSHEQALLKAKAAFDTGKPVLNIWLIKQIDIMASDAKDQVIWSTLKEKTHRDVISYRAGDKLKKFKERQNG
jgi:ring-1,2-phenylacetyl-CoA epoxidase subunit PaaB